MPRSVLEATDDPLSLIVRVDLLGESAHCLLPIAHMARMREKLEGHEQIMPDPADPRLARLQIPLIRRRGQAWVLQGSSPSGRPDPALVRSLRSAHAMIRIESAQQPIVEAAPEPPYRRRLVRLAFLAPTIQRAVLEGRQPRGMTLAQLLEAPIPLDWSGQAAQFGFVEMD